MSANRKRKLNELLTGLCATFDREFQPVLVDVWDKALADIPIEEIDRSVGRWVSVVGKKFPTPVEIRELISGDPAANSNQALETLHEAMGASGAYKSVSFQDVYLQTCIEHFGGWTEVCAVYREMEPKDLSYWEHNFRQLYQQTVKLNRLPRQNHSPGVFEIDALQDMYSYERGKLPLCTVDVYDKSGVMKVIPLADVSPQSRLVEFVRKQLESAINQAESNVTTKP